MRYAIISDVHANEAALRAVLTDAVDARAEKIICLGDVLGYGPDPVAALELVYRRAHVCLAGNHDDAVANRCSVDDFTSFAADAVVRHRAKLSQTALDWLRHLPYVCEFPGADGGAAGSFACAHGDFSDPKNFNYVLDPAEALPSWQVRTEQLLFVGHTHKPGIFVLGSSGAPHALDPADFVLEEGKRYLVNVGSVGYPRTGACRSFYCIYDDQSRAVFFRTLPFDVEGYAAKMHGQGLNEAPWMSARVEERRDGAVRASERFGKSDHGSGDRRFWKRRPERKGNAVAPRKIVPVPSAAIIAPADASSGQGRTARPNLVAALVLGALVLSGAGIWCTNRLVRALPREADRAEVAAPPKEGAMRPIEATDAPPTSVGAVLVQRRCTVPAVGRRVRFSVKLKRGSAPVWVHVRFEDGNGVPAGDGLWFQNVRQSKRSPKGGLVAPNGTTAAFLEVVKVHAEDVCEVSEAVLEPMKENAK